MYCSRKHCKATEGFSAEHSHKSKNVGATFTITTDMCETISARFTKEVQHSILTQIHKKNLYNMK